jgi:hypothetical protein
MAILSVNKDFVVKHGLVVTNTATIESTENAVSPSTGALTVLGGAGIAQDLWVGGTVYGAAASFTSTNGTALSVAGDGTFSNVLHVQGFVDTGGISVKSAITGTGGITLNSYANISSDVSVAVIFPTQVDISLATDATADSNVTVGGTAAGTNNYITIQGGAGGSVGLSAGGSATNVNVFNESQVTNVTMANSSTNITMGGGSPTGTTLTVGNPDAPSSEVAIAGSASSGIQADVAPVVNLFTTNNVSSVDMGSYASTVNIANNSTNNSSFNFGFTLALENSFNINASNTVNINAGGSAKTAKVFTTGSIQTIMFGSEGTGSNSAIFLSTTAAVSTSTGAVQVRGGVGVGGDIYASNVYVVKRGVVGFYDSTSSNYVGFKSTTTLSTSTIYVLPKEDGNTGQFLTTDGNKNLSWTSYQETGYPPFPIGDYGLGELYPGSEGAIVDAFGVNLEPAFDCMNPDGRLVLTDLGVLV